RRCGGRADRDRPRRPAGASAGPPGRRPYALRWAARRAQGGPRPGGTAAGGTGDRGEEAMITYPPLTEAANRSALRRRRPADVTERMSVLEQAVDIADGRLDPAAVAGARVVLDRALERL